MNKILKKLRRWIVRKLGGDIYDWDIRVSPTNEQVDYEVRSKMMADLYREYCKEFGESKADKMFEYFMKHSL